MRQFLNQLYDAPFENTTVFLLSKRKKVTFYHQIVYDIYFATDNTNKRCKMKRHQRTKVIMLR